MFNEVIISFLKTQLQCELFSPGRIDWVWSDPATGVLEMNIDKENLVDGILLFNIAVSSKTISNTLVSIVDNTAGSWPIYKFNNNLNFVLISPFMYFVKSNKLKFTSSVADVSYGFNYVTLTKDK